jgi:hypothetical protein
MTQGTRLLVLAAMASLALATPARAANVPASPVTFSECRGGISSIELVEFAAYNVTFRNTAAVAADEIRLSIPYGRRKVANFDLRGTFNPQVDTSQALRKNVNGGLYAWRSSQNDCIVDFVHFTDGTTWSRTMPSDARTKQGT